MLGGGPLLGAQGPLVRVGGGGQSAGTGGGRARGRRLAGSSLGAPGVPEGGLGGGLTLLGLPQGRPGLVQG